MEFSLSFLPNEVLVKVFSHLGVKDRLRASLVCKKWLHLSNCKSLLSDICVHINCSEGIQDFIPMTRNFLNFSFNDIFEDNYFIKLLKNIAPRAQYICFISCYMEKKAPIYVSDMPAFDCLTYLMLQDCDFSSLFASLPNLKVLCLVGKSIITDDEIALLQKTSKMLEVLRIEYHIAFDYRVYRRFYPAGLTYEEKPSPLILSFLALKSFIAETAKTLTELNFGFNVLTASSLEEIAKIKGLKLTKISLYAFNYYKSLNVLFKYQTNLVKICIDNADLSNDNIIYDLCRYLPNIKELHLRNCKISNHSLEQVFQLSELTDLSLVQCEVTTGDGFNEAISRFKATKIKKLHLYKIIISQLSASFMKEWTNIVYLNISSCHLTDDHVHTISTFMVNLYYLNIACNKITNNGLLGVTKANEENQVSSPNDEKQHYIKPLYNLKHLRELYLDFCFHLTDDGLIAAVKFYTLKLLSLKGLSISFETSTIIYENNPNLNKIILNSTLAISCPDEINKVKKI